MITINVIVIAPQFLSTLARYSAPGLNFIVYSFINSFSFQNNKI